MLREALSTFNPGESLSVSSFVCSLVLLRGGIIFCEVSNLRFDGEAKDKRKVFSELSSCFFFRSLAAKKQNNFYIHTMLIHKNLPLIIFFKSEFDFIAFILTVCSFLVFFCSGMISVQLFSFKFFKLSKRLLRFST